VLLRDRQQAAGAEPLDWLLGAIQCTGEQDHLQAGCRPPLGPAAKQGLQKPCPLRCASVVPPPIPRLIDKNDHCGSTRLTWQPPSFRLGTRCSPLGRARSFRSLPAMQAVRSRQERKVVPVRELPRRRARVLYEAQRLMALRSLCPQSVKCGELNLFIPYIPYTNGGPYDSSDPSNILAFALRSCLPGRHLVDKANRKGANYC
jgi:hypothetical protein